jgi:hypothetical protein
MSMDAPVMYGALNVLGLAGMQADQIREEQAGQQASRLHIAEGPDTELTPKAYGDITWATPATQPCYPTLRRQL